MAVVRPYGDPNAHGSLNETLTFRRYRGKVILQSFIRPTPTFTPLQIAQRARMTAANKAYSLLTNLTKWFYHKRSIQTGHTRKGLFMRAHMRGFLPSTLKPIPCKAIQDMIIFKPAGFYPDNLEISIYNTPDIPSFMLWNKLDEITEGEIPSINGPPGVVRGDVEIVDGKFNGALQSLALNSGLEFDKTVVNEEQGFFSWWMKTTQPVIDGFMQSSPKANRIMNLSPLPGGCDFFFGKFPTSGILTFKMPWWNKLFGGDTRVTWPADEWVHFIVAWDRYQTNGWSGAIYMNEIELHTTTAGWTPWTISVPTYNILTWPGSPSDDWGKIILDDLLISKEISNLQDVLENYDIPGARGIKFYGILFDNSNEYTKLQEAETYGTQVIRLSTMAGHAIQIPFRYLITVTWTDHNDVITNSTIRLPQLTILSEQVVELFLSRDWSVYWDPDFKRLACASRL